MKARIISNPGIHTVALLISFALIAYFLKKERRIIYPPSAYAKYITGFTAGEISRTSPIRIRFVEEMIQQASVNANYDPQDSPFQFSPTIYGHTRWIDTRTLEFAPQYHLNADQAYEVSLDLEKILPQIADSLRKFHFNFRTRKQAYKVTVSNPAPVDIARPQWQKIEGTVTAADYSYGDVEDFFVAYKKGEPIPIRWENSKDNMEFKFTIDSILRTNESFDISLSWQNYDHSFSGKKTIPIPALENFMVTHIKTESYPDQSIQMEFSDPLKKDQLLDGLIRIGNMDLKLDVKDHIVYIYPSQRITGSVEVQIEEGIESVQGQKLRKKTTMTAVFEDIYPQLKEVEKGTILPLTNILPFAFEAVNLSAVDLRVIKIAENNVSQFLQINTLAESSELKRVGSLMLTKKIMLDKRKDLKKWNRHVLDLSKLIQTEPGAIYQIALGFRKSYSLYECNDTSRQDSEEMLALGEDWDEPGYYYGYDSYEYIYRYDEGYADQENPCKRSYYHSGQAIVRNVLASNIGLIAKKGSEGAMFIAATDLLSTRPIENASIEVYDYQQQLIASGKTRNGISELSLSRKPFLIIAKSGKQKGYLRVDINSSISLSRFDIEGKEYHKGLKGFIYAERDIWRPGDSLFINFVLEDKLNSLPADHPVIFELYNPQQELIQRMVKTSSLNDFYTFHTCTSEDAPTGTYMVKIQAGASTFEKNIKIETILPNRLKIQLDWKMDAIEGIRKNLKGVISARWLHGGTAKNLNADVSMTLTEAATDFKNYKGFSFTDQTRNFESERKEIFKGTINEEGKADISAAISVEGTAPGMLKANFKTKVFEPGGSFSSDYVSLPFHPYERYAGIKVPQADKSRNMLVTDKDHIVQLVSVTPDGKPVAGKKIGIKVYKLSWKWWWDSSEDYEYSYNGTMYSEPIFEDSVTTKEGITEWKLRINYPDWGRYMIRACEEGGHCSSQLFYMDWPGWAGRARQGNPEGAKMLTFSSDKEVYCTGETITLNIPTGFAGRALLSLESCNQVIGSYWIEAQKGMTQFKFPATSAMAPNVYAHITLLQPHAQTSNDLPIRMYGILPIRVEDPKTHLNPSISMPDELAPEQKVSIRISESNGRAMTYTLAVVDEGLLDLTRYTLPGIWSAFNQRQALDVKTWDLFDDVSGASAMKVKNLLSIGGDGNARPLDRAKVNRFKPVVIFLGPFHVKQGESKLHTIQLPNYIGSVKTMVIAGNQGAYGASEKTTPVKKPLMILGTLPRVLAPNEQFSLPVSVFAMDPRIKNVSVTLETNDIIQAQGGTVSETKFEKPGEQLISFPLLVTKATGIGKIKITARSGKETAVYETTIGIRNPNPMVENLKELTIPAGQSYRHLVKPTGMKGTNTTILEVSSIPPLNLSRRLQYLIQYPYGCVEQTTSSVFPQVCLNGILNLSRKQREEVDKNIRAGIARLKTFQKSDGSLSYWPGQSETNEWGTCYAGHFMIEAELSGYSLPLGFKEKWKEYIRTSSRNYEEDADEELVQAYRLYLLALCKAPELGAMNRMRIQKIRNTSSIWYLAAAYHLAGQPEAAKELTKNASLHIANYQEFSNTFGSDERDRAILLQSLSIMGERTKAAPLVQQICNTLNGPEQLNTQETAYSLIAIANYTGKYSQGTSINFSYSCKAGEWKQVIGKKPFWQETLSSEKEFSLELKNQSQGVLFVKIVSQGIPEEGDKTDASHHLTLDVSYHTMDGKPLNAATIAQGTDFMAKVSIINPGDKQTYEQMSLTQIFPSGWEIHNGRLNGGNTSGSSSFDYQDIKDDRVNTFFDLAPKEKKTFVILLNASYEGKFYLPTVTSEAMYDNSVSARKHGQWVQVIKNKLTP